MTEPARGWDGARPLASLFQRGCARCRLADVHHLAMLAQQAFDAGVAQERNAVENWKREAIRVTEVASRCMAALKSIASNTCCDGCQEAALVARAALRTPLAPSEGWVMATRITCEDVYPSGECPGCQSAPTPETIERVGNVLETLLLAIERYITHVDAVAAGTERASGAVTGNLVLARQQARAAIAALKETP